MLVSPGALQTLLELMLYYCRNVGVGGVLELMLYYCRKVGVGGVLELLMLLPKVCIQRMFETTPCRELQKRKLK